MNCSVKERAQSNSSSLGSYHFFNEIFTPSKLSEQPILRFDKNKINGYLMHQGQQDFLKDAYEVEDQKNHLPKSNFISVSETDGKYETFMKIDSEKIQCKICKKIFLVR